MIFEKVISAVLSSILLSIILVFLIVPPLTGHQPGNADWTYSGSFFASIRFTIPIYLFFGILFSLFADLFILAIK